MKLHKTKLYPVTRRTRDKKIRLLFLIIAVFTEAVLINAILPRTLYAFHTGGVGPCEACHNMHGSSGIFSNWLLSGADPSSICLNCHAGPGSQNSPHIASDDGSALTPGGDFYWLKKNFSWAGGSSAGERHGHNIIAQDYGFVADTTLASSPGGNYMAYDLGCNSCHDPHGKTNSGLPVTGSGSYGSIPVSGTVLGEYRLLGGYGYDGGANVQGTFFTYAAPVAVQNAAVPYGENDSSHVAYGSGMSEWCANCHSGILFNDHRSGGSAFEHPAGNNASLGEYVDHYNLYISTGNLSGTAAASYLALVPFERRTNNVAQLDPTSTQGPDNSSNIMCLTCHRAHASAFRYIGRWDFSSQLVADSHPAAEDLGVTGNDIYYSYYGRNMFSEFGPGQRILCEKCHDVPKDGYPPGW